MFEIITQERLDEYLENVRVLNNLLETKQKIEVKLGLHGVDYSKDKVTSGHGNKLTEQERFTNNLLKINAQIDSLKPKLQQEHFILKTQISRVKKYEYRKILVYRYIEKWKWSEIIQDFFEFEDDYEEQKNDKYKDKIMYWHRRALEELQKVSSKPFIKYQQISIEGI